MARKTSKFLVGLFVTLGTLIIVVAVIWIGASKYFEKGKLYVAYYDESVQGLEKDSEVKYRGVKVGRVDQIRIAPDNRLIAVIMNIYMKDDLTQDAVAQLQLTGITGIMFINLDRRKPGEADLSPKIDFASEYPIIPSRPSDIHRIITGIEDIVNKVKEIDTKGISEELKTTVAELGDFFKSKKLKNIMAHLESTTENLDNMTGQLDKMMAEGKVRGVLVEARDALVKARDLFAGLNDELKAVKLPEIGGKASTILTDMADTTEKLQETSESLEALVDRLKDRPSDLIFGKEPKPRWNER
jgi:phospholipid/cholesterol/gamma-HCH transport system substrate-binding protein